MLAGHICAGTGPALATSAWRCGGQWYCGGAQVRAGPRRTIRAARAPRTTKLLVRQPQLHYCRIAALRLCAATHGRPRQPVDYSRVLMGTHGTHRYWRVRTIAVRASPSAMRSSFGSMSHRSTATQTAHCSTDGEWSPQRRRRDRSEPHAAATTNTQTNKQPSKQASKYTTLWCGYAAAPAHKLRQWMCLRLRLRTLQ
jgi:hypothetical protein